MSGRAAWLALLGALAGCSSSDAEPPASSADAGDAGTDDAAEGGDAAPCSYFRAGVDDVAPAPVHTPRWAFEPWISKDISDGDDTRAFVEGFRSRDIPVGAVVLDSPWETNYNTFVPDPVRYADFGGLVGELRAKDVRVVVWMTQMVNVFSLDLEPGAGTYAGGAPNYDEGKACGFFVDDAALYSWWKGRGSGVDFFSREASAWWHRQQDPLFALGVSGFKLDFGDSYVTSDPVATSAGPKPHQAYSEAYYADYYAYGTAQHAAGDFVTMVRPWDESYQFAGRFFARPEHAPVAWVGDNRRDWVGLADALDEMFRSARAGYAVVGSDVGGYLDRDDKNLLSATIPFSTNVFARWTAVGALSPFMQLHGRANITPWTVPDSVDQTVALYRYWAKLHHAMVPFWSSLAEEMRAGHGPAMDPIGDEASWAGDYRYAIGRALLVAPLLDDTGARDVPLPAGDRWFDWWSPAADAVAGGTTLTGYDATDRARVPLFVREGAIVPLAVEDDAVGLGTAASAGALTVLAWPGPAATSFTLHEADGSTTLLGARRSGGDAIVSIDRALATTLWRVRVDAKPTAATLDGQALVERATASAFDAATSGWRWDAATKSVWAKLAPGAQGGSVTLAGAVTR